ncbi:MAG TPA: hypothetical protein VK020_01100, partial [Microlunatus sp.]|nr:hypothetical protein [Microlunatus sp.]
VGALSGGETVLTALAGLRLRGDQIVLLDEPTNNLDRQARSDLYDVILRTYRSKTKPRQISRSTGAFSRRADRI